MIHFLNTTEIVETLFECSNMDIPKIMCDKQISKGVIYFDDFFLWWKLKNQIAYETREHFDRPQIVLI